MGAPADWAQLPLAAIRMRLDAVAHPAERARIAAMLRADARRGARSIAERCERREREQGAERARLARLFALREQLLQGGIELVAGVDEVGVGPLAGPLVAAAVVFPRELDRDALRGLDDSKRLTRRARARLDREIRRQARALCVAEISAADVDRLNPHRASIEAMQRAISGLPVAPDHVLVDARTLPALEARQTALVHGDARDASIAAASIVAKVHRDALMCELDARYPAYGFRRHMGYGTREHLAALDRLGPCPAHRRSFAPVSRALGC